LGNFDYTTYWYRNSTGTSVLPAGAWSTINNYANSAEAIDFAPGSLSDTYNQVVSTLNSQINCSFAYYSNSTFVPTVSALAFNTTDLFYKIGDDPNRLTKTPFSDIYATCGENSSHSNSIATNSNVLQWVMSKINGQTNQPCYCSSSATINDLNRICSTGTYTLQNLVGSPSVTWASSNPSGLAINSQTGFATRQNNFNGQVTITATIVGACWNNVLTRVVNVGSSPPIGTSSVNSNCSGSSFNVLNTSLSGICSANTAVYFAFNITDPNYSNFVYTPVSLPSGASWSGGGRTLNVTLYTPPSSGSRTATIALSATGPCGPYNVNFNASAVNISSGWRFSMSPNPTDGQVTISTDSESLLEKDSQNLIHAIKVTDPSGTRSESFEYKSGINSTTISLKDRQPGLYILSVFDGKTWTSKQLLVQK